MTDYKNESAFRCAVMSDLQSMGFLVYSIPDDAQQVGDAGYPCITAARAGQIIFVNCKLPDSGFLSEDEREWKHRLERVAYPEYVDYYWVFPEEWQEIMASGCLETR